MNDDAITASDIIHATISGLVMVAFVGAGMMWLMSLA